METVTRFAIRRRRWVFAVWLLALFAGVLAAGGLADRLSYDFSLPGQQGYGTERQIVAGYGTRPYPTYIPLVTVPDGQSVEGRRHDVAAVFGELRSLPGVRVVDYASTGDPAFVTRDGRTSYALVFQGPLAGQANPLDHQVAEMLRRGAERTGLEFGMTGYNQLSAGGTAGEGPSVLTETLIGAAGALAVLVFVFASFLALVPLVVAGVSILATFLIVSGLTTIVDVSFVVQFLIALVGLGVAIDYSLLVVSRWREERAHGRDNEEAVVAAMGTAGRAVLASGVTVAVSLMALVVLPAPFLRSIGYGGMLIPLVSVLVVLTLLPAMLASVGPRIDVPRLRKEAAPSRGWMAWARGVVRWRWVAVGGAVAALAFVAAPVLGIQIGQAGSVSLASEGPAHDGLRVLRDGGVGTGVLTPVEILVGRDGDAPAVAAAARAVPGVRAAVVVPSAPDGRSLVEVVPDRETVDSGSTAVVERIRQAVAGSAGVSGVAGLGATVADYKHAVYDNFPLVLSVIAAVTFLLLVRTFRSLLLPLKAVVLNCASITAVFGAATWFWQEGNGSEAVFGISGTGAMTFWLPVLVFAFLFGLSMDYEVFILARMREEYDRTGSTSAAVVTGMGRTGRLVTSAALILFFAFAALASAPSTEVKVFATALGVGILLDATLVRALLVPALVAVLGRWNWWLPAWLATVLRVEPSPQGNSVGTPPVHDPERTVRGRTGWYTIPFGPERTVRGSRRGV